jgi:hypothetical protein
MSRNSSHIIDRIIIIFYSYLPILHGLFVLSQTDIHHALPYFAYALSNSNDTIDFFLLLYTGYISFISIDLCIVNILIVLIWHSIECMYSKRFMDSVIIDTFDRLYMTLMRYIEQLHDEM